MTDVNLKNKREESIYQLRAEPEPQKHVYPTQYGEDQVIDLRPYLHVLWANRLAIAITVLAAILITVFVTTFALQEYFRAIAIIRPIPKAATAGRIAGMFGVGGGSLNSLTGLMGGAVGPGADEAQEYMTILESFAFNTALIERHHLNPKLFEPSSFPLLWLLEHKDPRWRAYKKMRKWFTCEYSIKTGNVTLYFKAKTPTEAERILGYYIDDLREKLRNREVL